MEESSEKSKGILPLQPPPSLRPSARVFFIFLEVLRHGRDGLLEVG